MPVPAPLQDVLIVDLTHVLAGPFGATILGDLGARIIKVERPEDPAQTDPKVSDMQI